ncbi:MAG: 30S ribosomal protein S20 [Candidatus Tagabacteria bacterium CG09_land_8_20_14_0_10_41_14]|uniref:Small ribosomal subunit protein bS20 n=2 Tax=Candidatus Tagaibacteriota TaxID=1817918 RepID=A0A2H0WKV8_9BACT|nr:MAG: 30S ribosomal protein S20 [Candidatus Tagabacteria bacterium CG09_land_8_20_14_0_10_41_14]PJE73229.1 MAG: 30S ribosomal protein S20 [Candidatus Tagabacteria bacterium CG10_big_fil_rev_8_21_14_0_10_40_13]
MPITKSAKKALRQSIKRKKQNVKRKDDFKKKIKEIRKLLSSSKKQEAEKLVPGAYKALDKAGKSGVIKKNAAARKKSRLMKAIKLSI